MSEIKFKAWHKAKKEMWNVTQIDFEKREISNGGEFASFDEIELNQITADDTLFKMPPEMVAMSELTNDFFKDCENFIKSQRSKKE